MRRSGRPCPVVAIAALLRAVTSIAAGPPAALLDADHDRVEARADVPSTIRKVGEVRLVGRGGATVVQTLLATKSLSRVVSEIRKKEEENWPADRAGAEDARRYLATLSATADGLVTARDAADDDGDRRLRLGIEFVASADAHGLALFTFDGDEVDGEIRPTARHAVSTVEVGRDYVLRNMRLILADAFERPDAELSKIGPLGPLDAVHVTP